MAYSVESLVFRAVAGVVNTAARAANSLLEVMYPPRYDAAHIWEDVPAGSVASGGPAPTDPPSGGVADPAGGTPPPPAGSLTWFGWCYPAIVEVLAEHSFRPIPSGVRGVDSRCRCGYVGDQYDWVDHVAVFIAERVACDPARAIAALQNLQTQE